MKTIRTLAGAMILLLVSGCSGLTELTTYWGNNAGSPDIQPTGYHADTQTGWMSYNDSTHLFFAFSFFNPQVQTLVLRNGLTVFLDETEKMKKDCFVRFPMIKRDMAISLKEGQLAQQQVRQSHNQRTSTQMLLDQAQTFELKWKNQNDSLQINPSVEKTDFHTFIALDTAKVLNVIIGIPIDRINPGGLSAMGDLLVGLKIGQDGGDQEKSGNPATDSQFPPKVASAAYGSTGSENFMRDQSGTTRAGVSTGSRRSQGSIITSTTAKEQALVILPEGDSVKPAGTEYWYRTTLARK